MNEKSEYESKRAGAQMFGSAVYIGGVLAATVLFITFVLSAFPEKAYFTRTIMSAAGLAVGCSMLAFPYALHFWVVSKKHRTVTSILYYIEMAFIAINTIVSFVNLLAKYANFAAPEWTVLYEPFSILSLIYVVFAWGTVFLTDPQAKQKAQDREFQEEFEKGVSDTKLEFLKSDEGRAAIANAAVQDIQATITADRKNRPFLNGNSNYVIDPQKGFVKKELQSAPLPTELQPEPLHTRFNTPPYYPVATHEPIYRRGMEHYVNPAVKQEQPSQTGAPDNYGPAWKNSTDIADTLDAYAWTCLSCEGTNPPYSRNCQWCQQPRTNGSPVTAFSNLPPARSQEDKPSGDKFRG